MQAGDGAAENIFNYLSIFAFRPSLYVERPDFGTLDSRSQQLTRSAVPLCHLTTTDATTEASPSPGNLLSLPARSA